MTSTKKIKAEGTENASTIAFEHESRFSADFSNLYSGYSSKLGDQLSRVACSISAQQFFSDFVASRRPCIIEGLIDDETWRRDVWDASSLAAKAGDQKVKVEVKDDEHARFGLGNEREMTFGEFLTRWNSGDSSLYMTTQDLDCDEEGRPNLTAAPVSNLIGEFPWNPRIAGNLVLQTINLWMGCSERPMTSGLHHDFHDNVYLLLVGTKRFRLFPPGAAENMYLRGTLSKIHENGRINFEGQATTADGVSDEALRSYEASMKLEAAYTGNESDVEAALEELLDAEHDDFSESNGSDEDFDEDFYSEDGKRDLQAEEDVEASERHRSDDEDEDHDTPAVRLKRCRECEPKKCKESTTPNNFSQIDLSEERSEIVARFPRFADVADTMLECTIHAGEMLYLPSGWFHEVSSFGTEVGTEIHPQHMALNYWFHPPTTTLFERPYESNFWLRDWQERIQIGLK